MGRPKLIKPASGADQKNIKPATTIAKVAVQCLCGGSYERRSQYPRTEYVGQFEDGKSFVAVDRWLLRCTDCGQCSIATEYVTGESDD